MCFVVVFVVLIAFTDNTSCDTDKYTPPAPRDPYAPPHASPYVPSSNYQPPAPQQSTFSYPGNQSLAYDTRNAPDSYVPQPVTQPYGTYNSDTSATSGNKSTSVYEPPYTAPQAPSYSSPPAPPPSKMNLATVPSPPAPTTTQVTRPKVSNAYDPPFLATSYSRRNVSGPARLGTGHPTPAYAAYQPTTTPPLPPPRVPAASSTYARPSSQPVTQTPDYTATYVPPPTQPQSTRINETNVPPVGPEPYTPGPYTSSAPPSLRSSESYAPGSEAASHPHRAPAGASDVRLNASQVAPDTTALQGSGVDFFDQFNQRESQPDPEELATESQSPPVPPVSSSPAPISPEVSHVSPYSPNTPLTSSPQKPLKAVSPPPRRTSQDSGQVLSPRQSPRPPSTSSPVYALSHPPRASPDSRKGSFAGSEYIPRTQTASPGLNGTADTVSPYAPPKGPATRSKSTSVTSVDRISSPDSSSSIAHDRYAPRGARVTNVYGIERTGSPSSFSARSSDGRQSTKPQQSSYLPPVSEFPYTPHTLSQEPTPIAQDPYAPSQHNRLVKPPSSVVGYGQSPYGHGADLSSPQEATIKPTIAPYAPSPSLVGANDPLGRTSVRVPVVNFGFGGKLVTCFHDAGMLNTGFDVALSSRTSTKVQLRNWKKLIPESALDFTTVFPGPLHADPGPPSTGIMKATASAQAKTKKTQLTKYLSGRIEEITQGLGYLHNGSIEKRTAEGKLVLVKLLKIMVENDGRLLGT